MTTRRLFYREFAEACTLGNLLGSSAADAVCKRALFWKSKQFVDFVITNEVTKFHYRQSDKEDARSYVYEKLLKCFFRRVSWAEPIGKIVIFLVKHIRGYLLGFSHVMAKCDIPVNECDMDGSVSGTIIGGTEEVEQWAEKLNWSGDKDVAIRVAAKVLLCKDLDCSLS